MPHPTRQAIVRWAASMLLVAFAVYCVGYVFLGTRTRWQPANVMPAYTTIFVEFDSQGLAATYLPLAMIESTILQRYIDLKGQSGATVTDWGCEPFHLPLKRTMRAKLTVGSGGRLNSRSKRN